MGYLNSGLYCIWNIHKNQGLRTTCSTCDTTLYCTLIYDQNYEAVIISEEPGFGRPTTWHLSCLLLACSVRHSSRVSRSMTLLLYITCYSPSVDTMSHLSLSDFVWNAVGVSRYRDRKKFSFNWCSPSCAKEMNLSAAPRGTTPGVCAVTRNSSPGWGERVLVDLACIVSCLLVTKYHLAIPLHL